MKLVIILGFYFYSILLFIYLLLLEFSSFSILSNLIIFWQENFDEEN
jgi:hypothetical protein